MTQLTKLSDKISIKYMKIYKHYVHTYIFIYIYIDLTLSTRLTKGKRLNRFLIIIWVTSATGIVVLPILSSQHVATQHCDSNYYFYITQITAYDKIYNYECALCPTTIMADIN